MLREDFDALYPKGSVESYWARQERLKKEKSSYR